MLIRWRRGELGSLSPAITIGIRVGRSLFRLAWAHDGLNTSGKSRNSVIEVVTENYLNRRNVERKAQCPGNAACVVMERSRTHGYANLNSTD